MITLVDLLQEQLPPSPTGSENHAGLPAEGTAWNGPCTDLGNAKVLARLAKDHLRYCWPWKKWLVWDGTRWQIDDTGAIYRQAQAAIIYMGHQALHATDSEVRERLLKHVLASQKRVAIQAMVDLARSEQPFPVLPVELDRYPFLLNVRNGTLDLQTGNLLKHAHTDFLTKLAPVTFDPHATCPIWLNFLHTIFAGLAELVAYVQRLLGYCLTGDVREQILSILWGSGANGKSTLLNAIMALLGDDYAIAAPRDLLMASKGDSHPTALASLHGKRLIVSQESGEGRRLDEPLVKQLTGGDQITARRMHEDFWRFDPTHKVFLVTNHKPEVRGTDEGIWRRQRLIPFAVRIPEAQQDKTLLEKLKEELPGILNWCMQGCLLWQQEGLGLPEVVKMATKEYRNQQDILQAFLDECCQVGPDYRIRSAALYEAYRDWCQQCGETESSQRKFGEAMTERGFERYSSNGRWYRGLAVRAPADRVEDSEEGEI